MLGRLRAQLQASSPVLDERTPNKIDPSSPSAVDLELHMQQLRAKMQEDMEHQVFLHKSMSDQAMACIKADFEQKVHMPLERELLFCFLSKKLQHYPDHNLLLKFHQYPSFLTHNLSLKVVDGLLFQFTRPFTIQ